MIAGHLENLKLYFTRYAVAYNRVFDRKNVFTHDVLFDLAKFCRAHETTFNPDPRVAAMLDGRREVFLRIQNYLNLTTEELMAIHKVRDQK